MQPPLLGLSKEKQKRTECTSVVPQMISGQHCLLPLVIKRRTFESWKIKISENSCIQSFVDFFGRSQKVCKRLICVFRKRVLAHLLVPTCFLPSNKMVFFRFYGGSFQFFIGCPRRDMEAHQMLQIWMAQIQSITVQKTSDDVPKTLKQNAYLKPFNICAFIWSWFLFPNESIELKDGKKQTSNSNCFSLLVGLKLWMVKTVLSLRYGSGFLFNSCFVLDETVQI